MAVDGWESLPGSTSARTAPTAPTAPTDRRPVVGAAMAMVLAAAALAVAGTVALTSGRDGLGVVGTAALAEACADAHTAAAKVELFTRTSTTFDLERTEGLGSGNAARQELRTATARYNALVAGGFDPPPGFPRALSAVPRSVTCGR